MAGELSAECAYDGHPASPRYKLCGPCWARIVGERQEMVSKMRGEFSETSPQFEWAVEQCVLWLKYKDGLL